mmetsp:Transcript_39676/g.90459  ORF Transcript_39676/g.90459 Transcript_39676/m.90459 type:complete len:222 (-) Transcript_39676:36-701(-)
MYTRPRSCRARELILNIVRKESRESRMGSVVCSAAWCDPCSLRRRSARARSNSMVGSVRPSSIPISTSVSNTVTCLISCPKPPSPSRSSSSNFSSSSSSSSSESSSSEPSSASAANLSFSASTLAYSAAISSKLPRGSFIGGATPATPTPPLSFGGGSSVLMEGVERSRDGARWMFSSEAASEWRVRASSCTACRFASPSRALPSTIFFSTMQRRASRIAW